MYKDVIILLEVYKMRKNGFYIVGFIFLSLVFLGCDVDDGYTSTVKTLSDTDFNGVFTCVEELTSINVTYDYKITFNGTNKMVWHNEVRKNGVLETNNTHIFEMEINSTHDQYRIRLWSNQFSDWGNWLDYKFNSPNSLTIEWQLVGSDTSNTLVYTKQW